jgi:hypothetical protein
MKLESVRALKQQVVQSVLEQLAARPPALQSFGVSAGSLRASAAAQPRTLALGVAGGKSTTDFRLAVRIQRRLIEADKELRETIGRLSKGEVEVRYVGRVSALATPWQQRKVRPLKIGCSVGHFKITAGTLGAFATDRKTGAVGILSNNHVLANENRCKAGDAILQPGALDGGKKKDKIASLSNWVPLKSHANHADCAFASLVEGIGFDAATLEGLGTLAGLRSAPLDIGDPVAKIGRTTGLTRGRVTAIEVDNLVINYDSVSMSFDRQIEIEGDEDLPFSLGGDSGSLIVDGGLYAGALLFAGSDQGGSNGKGLTYANPLDTVLDLLDIKLDVGALTS